MIKRPKKQSYNPQHLLVSLLLIPLIGFFVYATNYKPAFFIFLGTALTISISFLIFFHFHLIKKQAEIDLQKQDYLEKANLLEAEMAKEWQSIESFRKKIVNYSQMKGLTEKLSMHFTLNDTSKTLSSEINKLFDHKDMTVVLYLFHPKTGELVVVRKRR